MDQNLKFALIILLEPDSNAFFLLQGVQLEFRDEQTVQLSQGPGKEPMLWTFDRVFHGSASQADIFELSAKETAEDVLRGYNGTIFAYGQVRLWVEMTPFVNCPSS